MVPALPKGAAVEVQPLTLSAMARNADDASEAEDDAVGPHRYRDNGHAVKERFAAALEQAGVLL